MRTVSFAPIATDRWAGSAMSISGKGYTVEAMSISAFKEANWSVSVRADVDHGIPVRHDVESYELAQVMSELAEEIELVISLELHLSPA